MYAPPFPLRSPLHLVGPPSPIHKAANDDPNAFRLVPLIGAVSADSFERYDVVKLLRISDADLRHGLPKS